MKKFIIFIVFAIIISFSKSVFASNWLYDEVSAKWVKNITPSLFQFYDLTTEQLQSNINVVLGGANPNPAITSSSGEDLSNGYFAVCGGQINSTTEPMITNVRKGFNIMEETLNNISHKLLRFASSNATISSGTKCGIGGYFNLNWYIPTKYNYSGYNIVFKDSIYNPMEYALQLLVYGEGGTQIGSTQSLNSSGWNKALFAQTDTRPFRFKLNIPNTSGLITYFKAPEILLTSENEPATRSITIIKTGNGTITPLYGNLHDQDIEVFTLIPNEGETLINVTYNDVSLTPTDNGDGTYSYTTPLLTTDGTLNVTFSDIGTAIEHQFSDIKFTSCNGSLQINGIIPGETISVYSINGKLLHSSVAFESSLLVELSKGVYLIKIGTKISKVIL